MTTTAHEYEPVIGPAFSEPRLLDAAYALEQAIGFDGAGARA